MELSQPFAISLYVQMYNVKSSVFGLLEKNIDLCDFNADMYS